MALLTTEMEDEASWIVDSGSTSNMTYNKNYFKTMEKSGTIINVPNLRKQCKQEEREKLNSMNAV